MTDRIRHVTITLDDDYREDDAEPNLDAIRRIRGVAEAIPHVVTGTDRTAVRSEIATKLFDAVHDVLYPERKR